MSKYTKRELKWTRLKLKNTEDYVGMQEELTCKLEKRVEALENFLETSTYIQRMLRKDNRRYKQALEFYADGYNHSVDFVRKDRGSKARQALKEGNK